MATDPKKSSDGDTLGISFNEIHADEPREAVTASKVHIPHVDDTHEKHSHLSNQGQVFNVGKAYEGGHIETGTIVSDKKRNRPGLLENIQSAVHEWWGNARNALELTVEEIPKQVVKEKPVVAKVETRAEVVKKAAEKATFAPRDDHQMVVQKIRTFKQDVARASGAPVTLKEPPKEETRTWTHTTAQNVATHSAQTQSHPEIQQPSKTWAVPTTTRTQEKLAPSLSLPTPPKGHATIPKATAHTTAPIAQSIPTPLNHTPQTPAPQQEPPQPKNVLFSAPAAPVPTPKLSVSTPPPAQPTPTPKPVVPSAVKGQTPAPPTKIAHVVVPPTVTKKTFTPPPTSITAAPSVHTEKKIVSAPVAPTWQHTQPTETEEKPRIYTKKDFEKQAPAPTPKPPLSSLKSVHSSVPEAIHDSLTIPHETKSAERPAFFSHTPQTPAPQQEPPQPKNVLFSAPAAPVPTPKLSVSTPPPAQPTPTPKPVVPSEVIAEKPTVNAPPISREYVAPKENVTREPLNPAPAYTTNERTETQGAEPARAPISTPFQATNTQGVAHPNAPTYPVTTQVQATQRETQAQEGTPSLFQSTRARYIARFAVLGLIGLFGVTLAVLVSIYVRVFAPEGDTRSTILTVPAFFNTTSQTGVPLEGDSASLRARVDTLLKSGSGATHIYFTQTRGDGTHIATAQEFFTLLNSNLSEKTIRALDDAFMVGSIILENNAEPFIILRSYNFDALFSGLLAWEPYIQEDLSPLFGTTPVPDARFKDAVRGNASTRILYDSLGNEVLLYSFVNQNTVVITTSGEALSAVIEKF